MNNPENMERYVVTVPKGADLNPLYELVMRSQFQLYPLEPEGSAPYNPEIVSMVNDPSSGATVPIVSWAKLNQLEAAYDTENQLGRTSRIRTQFERSFQPQRPRQRPLQPFAFGTIETLEDGTEIVCTRGIRADKLSTLVEQLRANTFSGGIGPSNTEFLAFASKQALVTSQPDSAND